MSDVLIRRRKFGFRLTQREELCVMMEAEIGVILPQGKEHKDQEPTLEARKKQGKILY